MSNCDAQADPRRTRAEATKGRGPSRTGAPTGTRCAQVDTRLRSRLPVVLGIRLPFLAQKAGRSCALQVVIERRNP